MSSYINNIIEIPRMNLLQEKVKAWFKDSGLNVSKGFEFELLEEEIMVAELTGERKTDHKDTVLNNATTYTPQNMREP